MDVIQHNHTNLVPVFRPWFGVCVFGRGSVYFWCFIAKNQTNPNNNNWSRDTWDSRRMFAHLANICVLLSESTRTIMFLQEKWKDEMSLFKNGLFVSLTFFPSLLSDGKCTYGSKRMICCADQGRLGHGERCYCGLLTLLLFIVQWCLHADKFWFWIGITILWWSATGVSMHILAVVTMGDTVSKCVFRWEDTAGCPSPLPAPTPSSF